MRVLHILSELRLSGMEMMLLNSASEWQKHGILIEILATGTDVGVAGRKLEEVGYKIKHIPFDQNRIVSFLKLRNFLNQNNFNIIHIHTERNFFMYVLNSRITGHNNIVRTFHSIFQPMSLKGRARRHFDRKLSKIMNVKYISVGDSVAKNELDNYYTKSETIYNWYDNHKFSILNLGQKGGLRIENDISENAFVISTVGNCSSIKRHELILEALSLLPTTINWIFLHAGEEEVGCSERRLAERLGIANNCRFLGSITNVEEILAISDVFIMTSRLEGLGNAALEAMGSGIPAIITKVPGLNDLINQVDGVIGIDSSPMEIKDSIERVFHLTASERKELSIRIANQTEEKFSLSKGVENYNLFYRLFLK